MTDYSRYIVGGDTTDYSQYVVPEEEEEGLDFKYPRFKSYGELAEYVASKVPAIEKPEDPLQFLRNIATGIVRLPPNLAALGEQVIFEPKEAGIGLADFLGTGFMKGVASMRELPTPIKPIAGIAEELTKKVIPTAKEPIEALREHQRGLAKETFEQLPAYPVETLIELTAPFTIPKQVAGGLRKIRPRAKAVLPEEIPFPGLKEKVVPTEAPLPPFEELAGLRKPKPKVFEPLMREDLPRGFKQYDNAYTIASEIQANFPDKNIITYGSFAKLKRGKPSKAKPDLDLIIDDPTIAKEILEYNKRTKTYIGGGSLGLPEKYDIFRNPSIDVKIKIKNPEFPRTDWYTINPDGMARAIRFPNVDVVKKTGKPLSESLESFYKLAEKPPVSVPKAVKEPWEMTRGEFQQKTKLAIRDAGTGKIFQAKSGEKIHADMLYRIQKLGVKDRNIEGGFVLPNGEFVMRWRGVGATTAQTVYKRFSHGKIHEFTIQKALSEGKSVPPEVLKDYPDLAKAVKEKPLLKRLLTEEKGAVTLPEVKKVTQETKVRGLARHMEEKAIEGGLTKGFGDLPEYSVLNMADQAKVAADFISRNPEQARRVAMGAEAPPQGLTPEAVLVGIENQALKSGDVATLRDLAVSSELMSEATTMGQRIRTLGERNPESPVGAIAEVTKAREKVVQKRVRNIKGVKERHLNDLKTQMRKAKPTKETWASFIETIKC